MSSYLKVARYHFIGPALFVVAPWAFLVLTFAFNLVTSVAQGGAGPDPTKSLVGLYAVLFALGILSASRRALPFGLALGFTRRSYYIGTVGLAVVNSAAVGLVVAGLQAIERSTNGWGMRLWYFDIGYPLSGAWYLTALTMLVILSLVFAYGMWFGLVYYRWDTPGLAVFILAQVAVAIVALGVIDAHHDWGSLGRFFTNLTAAGLTGALAALAAVVASGGLAVMRRVTV